MSLELMLGSWAMALAAFVILVTKTGYPNHRTIAVSIYLVSLVPFVVSIWLQQERLKKFASVTQGVASVYFWHFLFALACLGFAYLLYKLSPITKTDVTKIPAEEFQEYIHQDTKMLQYLDDQLSELIKHIQNEPAFAIQNIEEFSQANQNKVLTLWQEFIEHMYETDIIKARYRQLHQINFTKTSPNTTKVFLLTYSALLIQYEQAFSLCNQIGNNDLIETFLNQEHKNYEIPKDTLYLFKQKITNNRTLMQLFAARVYMRILPKNTIPKLEELITNKRKSMYRLWKKEPKIFIKNPLDFFEKNAFKIWFPVQKNTSLAMSYIRSTTRKYHIDCKTVQQEMSILEPGDILLQRREWHATNLGIPGYWTHLALYIGTPQQITTMAPESANMLKAIDPKLYATWNSQDADGDDYSVIEAKRPGVMLNTLENSCKADSIAVLRPKVSTKQKIQAVINAFTHVGKPYDYNFDFRTSDALVCSELIYRAYQDNPNLFTLQKINGRPIMSPNSLAEAFATTLPTEQKFEFVLYLEGNEETGEVQRQSENVFVETWKRPKWYLLRNSTN